MPGEEIATPVEASADATPATDEAAEALFNASGDGKTAPEAETTETPAAAAPVVEKKDEPAAAAAPPLDPVKAAEARASQIEQEKNAAVVAAEAARLEAERKAAEPVAKDTTGFSLADVEKSVLSDLKDVRVKLVKDGREIEASLEDFMDDAKGYGEVARGAITAATAIASRIVAQALAPLQEKLAAYEGEKAKTAQEAAHSEFLDKVASETSHKDVATIENLPAFREWWGKQTDQMKSLAQSADVRDIDLVLSAFKSATGYKAAAPGKTDRQSLVDKQRADLAKSDKVLKATNRSQRGAPSSEEGDGSIETEADAQKAFDEAAAEAAKNR